MCRLNVPKRVTLLPNGRTFLARYKRVPRSILPPKIVMRKTYRQRAAPWGRRRQRGRGVFSFIKKVAKNHMVRQLAKTGLQYLPQVYDAATSRVKNNKIRKILPSDTARGLLDKAVKRYQQKMAGISNIDIEKYFKNDPNNDLKQNFTGLYSSNSITRYINFYKIVKERKAP